MLSTLSCSPLGIMNAISRIAPSAPVQQWHCNAEMGCGRGRTAPSRVHAHTWSTLASTDSGTDTLLVTPPCDWPSACNDANEIADWHHPYLFTHETSCFASS